MGEFISEIVLVTGGARSGKSSFALARAESKGGRRFFMATAMPSDDEMRERIRRHREERGAAWETIEETSEIAKVIRGMDNPDTVIVIDCITVWLANIFLKAWGEISKEAALRSNEMAGMERIISELLDVLKGLNKAAIYIVTNEVGMGIVPENRLSRVFRDVAGRLNQRLAEISDSVFFMVSGIPVKIK